MKKRIILICSLASSLAYSQVGIKTPNPTNTLDVNGTARIRQVDPGLASKVLTPAYTDANNVVVKIPTNGNYSVITNTVNIAAGATGNLISNLITGVYKVTILTGNGCTDSATAEFFVHYFVNSTVPSVNFYGLGGQIGFMTRSTTSNYKPTFTQVAQNNVAVSWSGVPGCQDGSDPTGFNYNLIINGSTISITNNGNVAKIYRINATRLD